MADEVDALAAEAAASAAVAHVEAAEAEAQADATETAAEAAVALAHSAAAAAEIDAAERVRDYAEELDACRTQILKLSELTNASLGSVDERHERQRVQLEALESRLATAEGHLHRAGINPGSSHETSGAVASLGGTAQLGSQTGAAGEASLGPVEAEAGASLGASSEEEENQRNQRARPKRRWI